MKRNPNTRNIFTAEGRFNRCIDRYNKNMALLRKMREALDRLNDKYSDNISIDEINKVSEECVIRCDECSYEFDITSDLINSREITMTNENGDDYTVIEYICPKCNYPNVIDEDDDWGWEPIPVESISKNIKDDKEETSENEVVEEETTDNMEESSLDIEKIVTEVNKNINESNNSSEEISCEESTNTKKKVINISNKNTSHKVIINKNKPIDFIRDERIINAINIAKENKSISETISMFNEKNLNININTDCNTTVYSTANRDITFISRENNDDAIGMFTINTKLIIVPHGNPIGLYNKILSQLNIEKVDNKFEEIGLDGEACIIKLADDSFAACNFHVDGKDLTISIIYDIDNK